MKIWILQIILARHRWSYIRYDIGLLGTGNWRGLPMTSWPHQEHINLNHNRGHRGHQINHPPCHQKPWKIAKIHWERGQDPISYLSYPEKRNQQYSRSGSLLNVPRIEKCQKYGGSACRFLGIYPEYLTTSISDTSQRKCILRFVSISYKIASFIVFS